VGTLKPWHGVHFLVSAFDEVYRRCASARLLIVGDGPLRADMEEGLRSRGLDGASHFTGAVNPEEVPGWIASMDVAVAPYPAMEGFYFSPLKLFEYMAAGRAVVASDIGQISGVLEEGVTGLLCAPGEPVSLAACLLKLESNPGLRRALGAAARARVLGRHTWSDVATQVLALIETRRTESQPLVSCV
jgi:glycosyltransferase involved in cell wall biosynthesis